MYLAEGNAERWKYTHTLRNHTQVFFVRLDDLLSCTEREKNYRTHPSAVSLSPRCQFDGEQKGAKEGRLHRWAWVQNIDKVFHASGGFYCKTPPMVQRQTDAKRQSRHTQPIPQRHADTACRMLLNSCCSALPRSGGRTNFPRSKTRRRIEP